MPAEWLLLACWAGWVAIDGTAFGQFMISRPLVACLVAGWIMGAPGEVVALAVILEAAHLVVLPVGASRYPEAGPPAVAGGAVLATLPPGAAALLTVVVLTLAWEWVSGRTIEYGRSFNTRFVANSSLEDQPRRHALAIAAEFGRGVVVFAVAAMTMALVSSATLPHWARLDEVAGVILAMALVALLAASARLFGDRTRLWATGLLAGALYLVLA
jgi:mannose/fructose/N-acetylgalactosamine-specific phosphotransferase system component IIC